MTNIGVYGHYYNYLGINRLSLLYLLYQPQVPEQFFSSIGPMGGYNKKTTIVINLEFINWVFYICVRAGWMGGTPAAADLQVRSLAGCGRWQHRTWDAMEYTLWCKFNESGGFLRYFYLHLSYMTDFVLYAYKVGLDGVLSRVVCICVQPQCSRSPMEELFHREPGLGSSSDGKRYAKIQCSSTSCWFK